MSGLYALSNYDWIITRNKRDMADFLLTAVLEAFVASAKDGKADIYPCNICAYEIDTPACQTAICVEGIHAWLDGRHEA